ncbi:beta-glucosidase family protein [Agromyces seonyuensis]|uniref:beta-glucosidase family protein n=1 Tax=Agromyces seonyuensis TaxID=2662446 RepID=UPI003014EA9A
MSHIPAPAVPTEAAPSAPAESAGNPNPAPAGLRPAEVRTAPGLDPDVLDRARALPLDEKVALLTGAGTWTLTAIPELGLRTVTVSDGPIGVRGDDERVAAALPAPSSSAATWDEGLQRRIGRLMADEARRKGVDVVLAPVVNLQRSPVGGRHFECLSEDPLLTARLAVAFVESLQEQGVAACVKHFIGNETETDRTEYLARMDERTLREVYLAPFEAVVQAGAWSIMAAYNGARYDGVEATATEHAPLVEGLLRGELGFDGVLVSDWLATKSTVESALGGLDLVMPGPGGPWGEALAAAVRDGRVSERLIDEKVARILLLADRVGALSGEAGRVDLSDDGGVVREPDAPEVRAELVEFAARGTVVLRNEPVAGVPVLPVESAPRRIALLGANAIEPFTQGGGSAFVPAPLVSLPADALRAAFPGAELIVARGGATLRKAPAPAAGRLTAPNGEPGLLVELLGADGEVRGSWTLPDAERIWFPVEDIGAVSARIRTSIALPEPGRHDLEVGPVGAHRLVVDDAVVSESARVVGAEVILDSSYSNPPAVTVALVAEAPRTAEFEATVQIVDGESYGRFVRLHLHHRVPGPSVEDELAEAVAAAAAADLAIVVVGTNPETESEGWDRPDLALPGRQDELVRRAVAANPRTVVVVNAGAPVILPWLDDVPAALWWWLPGQEAGTSLAAVLTGAIEPSGRLPWTLPAAEADVPVLHGLPVDGYVDYDEGVDVGHRGWLRADAEPARPFGYGLGYADWAYESLDLAPTEDGGLLARVAVRNIGARPGREVVQAYLSAEADVLGRPLRWLAGFAVVDAEPGETVAIDIPIARRSLEHWATDDREWQLPPGGYRLHVGRSVLDLRLDAGHRVPGPQG